MKCSTIIFASILGLVSASPSNLDKRSNPQGCDTSGWQGNVNWAQVKADGASFAIVKVNSIPLNSLTPFTKVQSPGNRRHGLYQSLLRPAVRWVIPRRPDPWRIPLRSSRREFRHRPSRVLSCPRWWVVSRRQNTPWHD